MKVSTMLLSIIALGALLCVAPRAARAQSSPNEIKKDLQQQIQDMKDQIKSEQDHMKQIPDRAGQVATGQGPTGVTSWTGKDDNPDYVDSKNEVQRLQQALADKQKELDAMTPPPPTPPSAAAAPPPAAPATSKKEESAEDLIKDTLKTIDAPTPEQIEAGIAYKRTKDKAKEIGDSASDKAKQIGDSIKGLFGGTDNTTPTAPAGPTDNTTTTAPAGPTGNTTKTSMLPSDSSEQNPASGDSVDQRVQSQKPALAALLNGTDNGLGDNGATNPLPASYGSPASASYGGPGDYTNQDNPAPADTVKSGSGINWGAILTGAAILGAGVAAGVMGGGGGGGYSPSGGGMGHCF